MTSLVGIKSETSTDRYSTVENQVSCLRSGAMRCADTNRGSPSAGSEALPVARTLTALLYAVHSVTNLLVCTTCTRLMRRNAPMIARALAALAINVEARAIAGGM